jgi:serine protease Do
VLVIDALTANPGAAGGPLLDARGRFIGLVGKVIESAATNTRINYAVPGEALIEFLQSDSAAVVERPPPQTAATGKASRPYLGIKLSRLGYRQVSAYVQRVSPNSPAAKAGIQADDLILAIDGRRVGDVATFDEAVARLLPGQTVQVVVKRGPDVQTLSLRVEAME